MTPEQFLREGYSESLPSWLATFDPKKSEDQRVLLTHFFASRVVFYPGSGTDGHAVKVFGSSHSSHCFVYADYLVSEASIRAALSTGGGFLGYRSINRTTVHPEQLSVAQWSPHITATEFNELDSRYPYRRARTYGFLEMLERIEHLNDAHGPQRLAILFLGADGHATYDALFCQQGQRAPFAVLIQDHGFSGNYSDWGRNGIMSRVASETRRLPEFLLADPAGTDPWSGYTRVEGLTPSIGGQWANRRSLYRRDSANRDTSARKHPSS